MSVIPAIEQTALMTLEDFVRLYDTEGPFEVIDGERVALMLPVAIQAITNRLFFTLLFQHCVTHRLGEVFAEGPFVQLYKANWVKGARVP
ncbi:MAG: hypothetical protein H7X77_03035, partial [Anaerolineae bacterium]|nr:hypothetical protein [Anaerolineae bacterium]